MVFGMKIQKSSVEITLQRNLHWFINSGIMDPADGSWGVAERVVQIANNDAIEKIREVFPVLSDYGDYGILEHRRPDCNFETALLFLLAGDYFKDAEYRAIGNKILHYLFNRSGLRMTGNDFGVWNWHSAVNGREFWFDDNGWIAAIMIVIGNRWPELDELYDLKLRADALVEKLKAGMNRCLTSSSPLKHGCWPDPERYWFGEIRQPHWGTPVVTALLLSGDVESAKYYHQSIRRLLDDQSLSEWCYALFSASLGARISDDDFFRSETERILNHLLSFANPNTGTIPSQHCEAPAGTELVDLIYTDNWFLAALSLAIEVTDDHNIASLFNRLLMTILSIQDKSDSKVYNGCWRGMYDLKHKNWGGGNSYEGGAGSIYSGWTNAVISLTLIHLLIGDKKTKQKQ